MEDGIDNISEWIQLEITDTPDELIRRVGVNVSSMVMNNILQEGPCVLIQLGRKASHLINRHELRLKENEIDSCLFIRIHDIVQIRPDYKKGNKIIVFADTIHSGSELFMLLSLLQKNDEVVSKIYCYLKNKEGIENLLSTGLIEEENVVGIYDTVNENQYKEKYRELQAFFRSRIEPMDPDLCFNIYAVSRIINSTDLDEVIIPNFNSIFKDTIIKKETDITGMASNILEINYAFKVSQEFLDICKESFNTQFNIEIDVILFSIKINQRINSSVFSIWIKPTIINSINPCDTLSERLTDEKKCYLNIYSLDEENLEAHKRILCPFCIHSCLSDYLFSLINEPIIDAFMKKGIECTLIVQSRP